jgi:putative hydroxymethylpyrimidine transport system permease protein
VSGSPVGRIVAGYGPAALIAAAAIGLWELVVRVWSVPSYIMPPPSGVARAFDTDGTLLASATWVTVQEVVAGFALAVVAGVAIAVVLHLSGHLRRALTPLLVASQTVPVVVLAPVLVFIMGYGFGPKLVIVALICFFPVVVNMLDGLRSVDPELVTMMRTLHASKSAILRRVEVPASLPLLFSGLRVAATYASIGAVFGEWSGSTEGLGYVMLQATPSLETERVLAAVVVLSIVSLILFAAVGLAERALAPWAREP